MPRSDCPSGGEPAGVEVAARNAAAAAELVYVDDRDPGIRRVRKGRGFGYRAPDGHWLTDRSPQDRATLARIRGLAIPPAYTEVWICPLPDGHLQATARDARGRKQYRYHARWRDVRDDDKFSRMKAFGEALPALRERVDRDLAPSAGEPGRAAVLAALVRLLDRTRLRVGNGSYARDNRSYGLSTLRQRHAEVQGPRVRLHFRGKSGVWHDVALHDRRVARVLRRCQALSGQRLFQYTDSTTGVQHGIDSGDVNDYIREATGGDFTAKDFRTWHGSVLAWRLLAPLAGEAGPVTGAPQALKEVARALGNTVAVCRKAYVHPGLLACAEQQQWPCGAVAAPGRGPGDMSPAHGLGDDERGLLAFLEAWTSPGR